jgi:hypothetical protein
MCGSKLGYAGAAGQGCMPRSERVVFGQSHKQQLNGQLWSTLVKAGQTLVSGHLAAGSDMWQQQQQQHCFK